MKYLFILLFSVFFTQSVSSQTDGYLRHKVAKSETVTQIAQKYSVTPAAIYRLNPDAHDGISENEILLIPSNSSLDKPAESVKAPTTTAASGTHLVQAGETLFSLAKRYGISVDAIKNANGGLAGGLKSGQTIHIPGEKAAAAANKPATTKPAIVKTNPSKTTALSHIVAPGETKFSIARKYGISVGELERQNPAIKSGLPAGYTLSIVSETRPENGNDAAPEKPKPVSSVVDTPLVQSSETIRSTIKTAYANYEVKPGETLFGLAQSFNISQDELIRLNPTLKEGVRSGMILKVPGTGSIVVETRKDYADLTKSIKKSDGKELVLLLPFNASKIQADSIGELDARLKKDAFLNLTLDFYSGALMAIDSAKTLGININVRILDSEESKSSSNVLSLIQSNNLKNAAAVIGPFYQEHAEKAAQELAMSNVPVISPLSKESGRFLPNLFQAMPSEQMTRKAVLDFLVAKNANVIVVNDPKRGTNRQFISENYKTIQFADLDASGNVIADKLKSKLVKGQMNYIILDTEKTGMILATTNVLLAETSNFQIQIAIIEQNDTLDFEEVSMKRLTILKLIYPSMTRDNDSDAARQFRNAYRAKNRVLPNQFATRGFDVTFDTLLRLSQGKKYADSALCEKTEQIESKFDFAQHEQGNINKGIYILQYNEDLSVKEVE